MQKTQRVKKNRVTIKHLIFDTERKKLDDIVLLV